MKKQIRIEEMKKNQIDLCVDLWMKQFHECTHNQEFHLLWSNKTEYICDFLKDKVHNKEAIVAFVDQQIVGYLVYESFTFHDAKTAFVPFIGNAAMSEERSAIYTVMYQSIAKNWVQKEIKSHYLMIPYWEETLKQTLFDIGFGAYVVDAFSKPHALICEKELSNEIEIVKAQECDVEELTLLVKNSNDYYAESPIFLMREEVSMEEVRNFVKERDVFLAKKDARIIGFMNASISKETDLIALCLEQFRLIDEIGAYILEEYRGMNIGYRLLNEIMNASISEKCPMIHVDFETANSYGNCFWKKYFIPEMLSVKRVIHADF